MERWKMFEMEVYNYVKKIKEEHNFPFQIIYAGKEDSTESDIVISKDGKKLFTIEAKLSPARGGQFVVRYNGENYEFSIRNKTKAKTAEKILKFLNDNPEEFANSDSSEVKVNPTDDSLKEWVINTHKDKGCKFIITSTELNSFKAVIPIDDAVHKFVFGARLRKKPSGSRRLPKYLFEQGREALCTTLGLSADSIGYTREGKRTVAVLPSAPSTRYIGKNFYLSDYDITRQNEFNIRVTSNTRNDTVEFTLIYNGDEVNTGKDLLVEEFKRHL
ncbi:MAG TPA: hypothetical protein PK566_02185 [Pseudobacteroides sp.]|nr:hypothetical protein [Pseudobacteroides sp.]